LPLRYSFNAPQTQVNFLQSLSISLYPADSAAVDSLIFRGRPFVRDSVLKVEAFATKMQHLVLTTKRRAQISAEGLMTVEVVPAMVEALSTTVVDELDGRCCRYVADVEVGHCASIFACWAVSRDHAD
jgi:hypothetical protein